MKDFLSTISLFQGLDDTHYDYLIESAVQKAFPKDSLVFEAGNKAKMLYLLRKGLVKMYKLRKGTQKEEIVCLVRSGGFFCLAPLLSREEFHINAGAIVESKIIGIPKETVMDLIKDSHAFSKNVIRNLACNECNLCETVCDLSLSTTKERLAKYLLKEFNDNRNKRSFSLPMNQSQLASYLGTVRETVSRDLASLKKANIIDSKNGKIFVLDQEELHQIAENVFK